MPSIPLEDTPTIPPQVRKVLASYDEAAKAAMLELRTLILATARVHSDGPHETGREHLGSSR